MIPDINFKQIYKDTKDITAYVGSLVTILILHGNFLPNFQVHQEKTTTMKMRIDKRQNGKDQKES